MHINIWDAREPNESYIIDDFLICIWFTRLLLFSKKKTENILWFMWNYQNTNIKSVIIN